jgi:hypothetical protein
LIDDIKKTIADLASKLFNTTLNESNVSVRTEYKRGIGRVYWSFIVDEKCDDLIECGPDVNYKHSYEVLLKKIRERLDKIA